MKLYPLILLVLISAGCIKQGGGDIEFSGITPGVKSGVFIVKTIGDSAVYGENIKDGKFTVTKKQLKEPGYYKLNITDNNYPDDHEPFEVYLEGGKYTIETEAGKLYKYPKITSTSKKQEQLSAFYNLSDKLSLEAQQEEKALNEKLKKDGNKLSADAFNGQLKKLSEAQEKTRNMSLSAFKEFVKRFPESEISVHLMSKLDYEADPVSFYALFKTLSATARNSDEGKEIGDKLSHMVKLVAGSKAPEIVGHTPEGKPFDPKTMTGKKVWLIDFWRAGNNFSRENHQKIIALLGQLKNKQSLGVISVSLDSKTDWWTTAINDDHLTWTQVSDLKGDDSPNAVNWSISKIPTYYLLDSNWTIIQSNIDIGNIEFEVGDYIRKHS